MGRKYLAINNVIETDTIQNLIKEGVEPPCIDAGTISRNNFWTRVIPLYNPPAPACQGASRLRVSVQFASQQLSVMLSAIRLRAVICYQGPNPVLIPLARSTSQDLFPHQKNLIFSSLFSRHKTLEKTVSKASTK